MNSKAIVVKRRIFSPAKCKRVISLNAVLRTVDGERLDEKGESSLWYNSLENLIQISWIKISNFWKYNTKVTWAKEL
jgi:hypothetical protein